MGLLFWPHDNHTGPLGPCQDGPPDPSPPGCDPL